MGLWFGNVENTRFSGARVISMNRAARNHHPEERERAKERRSHGEERERDEDDEVSERRETRDQDSLYIRL